MDHFVVLPPPRASKMECHHVSALCEIRRHCKKCKLMAKMSVYFMNHASTIMWNSNVNYSYGIQVLILWAFLPFIVYVSFLNQTCSTLIIRLFYCSHLSKHTYLSKVCFLPNFKTLSFTTKFLYNRTGIL